jgi:hypothetical protein
LVVARSGSLTGDVRVARLVIQDGASFSGNVSMGPPVDTFAPVADAPVATTHAEPPAAPPARAPEAPRKPSAARVDAKPKGKAKR